MKIRTFSFAIILAAVTWGGQAQAQALAPQPFRADVDGVRALRQSSTPTQWQMPNAEAVAKRKKWRKIWIGSMVAFAAVNIIDAHSSRGKNELNPLLRGSDGTFSATKALAVKSSLGAGFFAWQMWNAKRHPEKNLYKAYSITNGVATGTLAAVAANNYGNRAVR